MSIDILLLVGAVVVVAGVVVAKIGDRIGLPALLLFLGLGVLMGLPSHGTSFTNPALAHDLGFAALVLILADGGLSTKWRDIKPAIWSSVLLATLGVGVTVVVMTVFLVVLKTPLAVAVVLAAIMAPTDSAAVFSILRKAPLPSRLRATLEGESGLNDAPTVLLVIAATELALGKTTYADAPLTAMLIAAELIGGVVGGAGLSCPATWRCRARASIRWRRSAGRSSRTGSGSRRTCRASPRCTCARSSCPAANSRTATRRGRSPKGSAGSPRSGSSSCWVCWRRRRGSRGRSSCWPWSPACS